MKNHRPCERVSLWWILRHSACKLLHTQKCDAFWICIEDLASYSWIWKRIVSWDSGISVSVIRTSVRSLILSFVYTYRQCLNRAVYGSFTLTETNSGTDSDRFQTRWLHLYYAKHVHIAQTQTQIHTPYFCVGQESKSRVCTRICLQQCKAAIKNGFNAVPCCFLA